MYKLENVKLGRMRKLLGARAPVLVLVTPVSFFVDYAAICRLRCNIYLTHVKLNRFRSSLCICQWFCAPHS